MMKTIRPHLYLVTIILLIVIAILTLFIIDIAIAEITENYRVIKINASSQIDSTELAIAIDNLENLVSEKQNYINLCKSKEFPTLLDIRNISSRQYLKLTNTERVKNSSINDNNLQLYKISFTGRVVKLINFLRSIELEYVCIIETATFVNASEDGSIVKLTITIQTISQ